MARIFYSQNLCYGINRRNGSLTATISSKVKAFSISFKSRANTIREVSQHLEVIVYTYA